MKILTSKLSSKNQTVVPAAIRKLLNLKPGDELKWQIVDGEVRLALPITDWVEYTSGLGKEAWEGIDTDEYINNLRDEWD